MREIIDFIDLYHLEVIISTLLLSLLSIIIVIINSIKTRKIMRRYDTLMRGNDNKDLESILKLYMDNVEIALEDVSDIKSSYSQIATQIQGCIQKVHIIRYNAFDNVGSDQSYSIALLDNDGNGIVLTGLFGRETSSTYAKPVKNGKSSHPLTAEEKEVIARAIN